MVGEQRERERVAKASKVCPCGNSVDMMQPGASSCSICHERHCSTPCALRHSFTVHEVGSTRGRRWLAVNGSDDVQHLDQRSR